MNLQTTGIKTVDVQTASLPLRLQNSHLQNRQIQSSDLIFELEEALTLKIGHSQSVLEVLTRVRLWAGSDPFLIGLLSRQMKDCLLLTTCGEEVRLVDELVQRKIIEDWRQNAAAVHLSRIESNLLSYEQLDSLLILYLKVLQRGGAEANDSLEQAALLSAGIVALEGDVLKVANAIYENVFDLAWIERQIPGITRPVSIIRSGVLPVEGSRRLESAPPIGVADLNDVGLSIYSPTSVARLYSKAMVLLCFVAVVAAVMTTYFRDSKNPAIASPVAKIDLVSLDQYGSDALDIRESNASVSVDKQHFDRGAEHARNGRWLMVMREFCLIPKTSAYFKPAQRSVEKWMTLYEEDIRMASDVVKREHAQSCPVVP